jgi:hypothetical protein
MTGLPLDEIKELAYQLNTWSRSSSLTSKVTLWGGSGSFLKNSGSRSCLDVKPARVLKSLS